MASRDELIAALRHVRDADSKELAAQLGVSQPTLSRLIAAAGNRVCRMGRARATRYALRRSLPGLGSRLAVRHVNERGIVRSYATIHLLANARNWLQRDD